MKPSTSPQRPRDTIHNSQTFFTTELMSLKQRPYKYSSESSGAYAYKEAGGCGQGCGSVQTLGAHTDWLHVTMRLAGLESSATVRECRRRA